MTFRSIIIFLGIYLLGNYRSFSQAQIFARGVISNDGVFGLSLSGQGNEAIFVRSSGKRDTLLLYDSRLVESKWRQPKRVSIGEKPGIYKDIDPFVTPDGRTLIFNSTRPIASRPNARDFNVWIATRKGRGWKKPVSLDAINSDAHDFFATITSKGTIYFTSIRPDGLGEYDIYRAELSNGKYLPPQVVGPPISSKGEESNPFISPDEDILIFLKTGEGTYGDSDLYISFRNGESWTQPMNLGPEVNTADGEFAPFLDVGTETLYFTRIRRGKPSSENIYFIRLPLDVFRVRALDR